MRDPIYDKGPSSFEDAINAFRSQNPDCDIIYSEDKKKYVVEVRLVGRKNIAPVTITVYRKHGEQWAALELVSTIEKIKDVTGGDLKMLFDITKHQAINENMIAKDMMHPAKPTPEYVRFPNGSKGPKWTLRQDPHVLSGKDSSASESKTSPQKKSLYTRVSQIINAFKSKLGLSKKTHTEDSAVKVADRSSAPSIKSPELQHIESVLSKAGPTTRVVMEDVNGKPTLQIRELSLPKRFEKTGAQPEAIEHILHALIKECSVDAARSSPEDLLEVANKLRATSGYEKELQSHPELKCLDLAFQIVGAQYALSDQGIDIDERGVKGLITTYNRISDIFQKHPEIADNSGLKSVMVTIGRQLIEAKSGLASVPNLTVDGYVDTIMSEIPKANLPVGPVGEMLVLAHRGAGNDLKNGLLPAILNKINEPLSGTPQQQKYQIEGKTRLVHFVTYYLTQHESYRDLDEVRNVPSNYEENTQLRLGDQIKEIATAAAGIRIGTKEGGQGGSSALSQAGSQLLKLLRDMEGKLSIAKAAALKAAEKPFVDSNYSIMTKHLPEIYADLSAIMEESFQNINIAEFDGLAWSKEGKEANAPTLMQNIKMYNKMSEFFQAEILGGGGPLQAKQVHAEVAISRLIGLGEIAIKKNNFNLVACISATLDSSAIHRIMKQIEPKFSEEKKGVIADLHFLTKRDKAYQNARVVTNLAMLHGSKFVPYTAFNLSDLTFQQEGNPDSVDLQGKEAVNGKKITAFAHIKQNFKSIQANNRAFGMTKGTADKEACLNKLNSKLPNEDELFKLSKAIFPSK